jgi:carboxymethylenebutenolidase
MTQQDEPKGGVSRRTLLGGTCAMVIGMVAKGAGTQDAPGQGLHDPNLIKQEIEVDDKTRNVHFRALLVQPKEEQKRGSVIVIHEIFGLSDHIRDVACRIASAGYNALAPDLFTQEGPPPSAAGGFGSLLEFVNKIPDQQILDDLKGAARYLRQLPTSNQKVGVVGFCWGGRFAMLLAAEDPTLNAAVAYYGRISGTPTPNQPKYPIDVVPKMQVPLMGHFGEEDQAIPPPEVKKFQEALAAAHKTAEIYEYPGAGHAFNNDTRETYRPEAAKLAFQRTLDWFAKYLKS